MSTDLAIERTMKAICLHWAHRFAGEFHPDATQPDLAPHLHQRFEEEMQYLWLNSNDPFRLASEANLRAKPATYHTFDSCYERD